MFRVLRITKLAGGEHRQIFGYYTFFSTAHGVCQRLNLHGDQSVRYLVERAT